MREITKRFRVEPGDYLIIPSTYEADRNCEFMLRLFTERVVEYRSALFSNFFEDFLSPTIVSYCSNLEVDKNEEDLVSYLENLQDKKVS
jgi:hypothetical protein